MFTFCKTGNDHWFDYLASALNVFVVFQGNRVTMKLDVSYTDHSHIIGKGGMTIKKVMEETGCHIHFPDSNRSNMNEKSNQVSIAGELDGVEKARARVRVGPYLIRMC
jgi:polyribonucleotide nucleotidyltransferase